MSSTILPNTFTPITTEIPEIPVDEYKSDPDLAAAVEYATENCKPQLQDASALTKAQEKSISETLKMMNIGQCTYKKGAASATVCAVTLIGGGCGTASAAYQQSTGCEQISVVSNIMNQCTQQLSCMLNQVKATSTTNVAVFQDIYMEAGDVTDSKISLTNTSTGEIKTVNIAQSSVQSAIGATITQGLNEALKQAATSKNEAFADPTSQKNMQQLLSNMQSVASNTTVNQSVAETTKNILVNQKIKVILRNISGSTLELKNENVLTILSENYVYNALDQLFTTASVQDAVKAMTQESVSENKGVDVTSGSKWMISMFGSVMKFWIVIVSFLLIVAVFVLYKRFLKNKK